MYAMKLPIFRIWPVVVSIALFASSNLPAQNLERMISTQTRMIRHEATEHQRKVAEARAQAYMAAQRRILAEQERAAQKSAAKKSTTSSSKERTARSKKMPRYIAVDTVKDKRSSPKAKKAVMLWDTQAEELVGNEVYDLESPPPLGKTAKFETYSAQYVGTGT